MKRLDLTNKRFGKIVCIKPLEKNNHGEIVWLCKCDCGNYCKKSSGAFKNISKIAVVGYGITSNSIVLKKIMDIVKEFNVNVYSIDITNTKIIITFDEKVDNKLLELLHNKIFERLTF